jgi:hypothetical protein
MIASDIINRARIVLNDADGVRWLDSELLGWINDGQRVIALVRPDACVSNSTITLVAGTKQSIPNDGLRLLDVMRNINPDNSGGRVVRHVDRDVLDTQNVNWHSESGQAVVKNYIYDNRDPKTFYVYPPALNTAKLEIIYSKNPTDVTATGSTVAVADIYADPLLNYVLHRAYSKDAEFAQNFQLSATYLQIFQSMLGIKTSKDAAFSPDLNSKGRTTAPSAASLQMGGV